MITEGEEFVIASVNYFAFIACSSEANYVGILKFL